MMLTSLPRAARGTRPSTSDRTPQADRGADAAAVACCCCDHDLTFDEILRLYDCRIAKRLYFVKRLCTACYRCIVERGAPHCTIVCGVCVCLKSKPLYPPYIFLATILSFFSTKYIFLPLFPFPLFYIYKSKH